MDILNKTKLNNNIIEIIKDKFWINKFNSVVKEINDDVNIYHECKTKHRIEFPKKDLYYYFKYTPEYSRLIVKDLTLMILDEEDTKLKIETRWGIHDKYVYFSIDEDYDRALGVRRFKCYSKIVDININNKKYINKFIKNTRKYDKLWDDDEKQIERLGIND